MEISKKYLNIIFKKQKLIEFITIFLIFVAIGFRFGKEGTKWFWNDYPFIAMLVVLIGLLLSLLWIKIEKRKTQLKLNEIRHTSKNKFNGVNQKINQLTTRQKEILNLIIKGKSNKEIMDELFIELSTLKTHINHLYKILEIANRKQARAIGNYINHRKFKL